MKPTIPTHTPKPHQQLLNKQCIVRTFSGDIWFGTLSQKVYNEITLTNARQILHYKPAKSISTSAIATYGILPEQSRVAPTVNLVWLEANTIILCTPTAIDSITLAPDATPDYNITVE